MIEVITEIRILRFPTVMYRTQLVKNRFDPIPNWSSCTFSRVGSNVFCKSANIYDALKLIVFAVCCMESKSVNRAQREAAIRDECLCALSARNQRLPCLRKRDKLQKASER